MSKHKLWELQQMQALPLEAKIRMTQQRIKQWHEYWHGDIYVAFSGGKDSTVLKHLVEELYPDTESLFCDTGLEYPECRKFAMSQKNVTVVRPKMRFDQIIKKYGYPVISKEIARCVQYARKGGEGSNDYKRLFGTLTHDGKPSRYNMGKYSYLYDAPFKISAQCCYVMKKAPSATFQTRTGKRPMLGLRTEESTIRTDVWLRRGCNSFAGAHPASMPMAFWTEQDVLKYIKEFNIPYSATYGDIISVTPEWAAAKKGNLETSDIDVGVEVLKTTGLDRTGCIFCAFGAHMEECPTRFQRLKETHPKQYEFCMGGGEMVDGMWQPNEKGLGLDFVLDWLEIPH